MNSGHMTGRYVHARLASGCFTWIFRNYAHAGAHHVSNIATRDQKYLTVTKYFFHERDAVPRFKPHRINVSSLEILLHAPRLQLRVESGTAQGKHNRDSRTYTYNGQLRSPPAARRTFSFVVSPWIIVRALPYYRLTYSPKCQVFF